jgi:hypothetical protein
MPAKMPEMPLKGVIKKTLTPKGISPGMEEDTTRGLPMKPKKKVKPMPQTDGEPDVI